MAPEETWQAPPAFALRASARQREWRPYGRFRLSDEHSRASGNNFDIDQRHFHAADQRDNRGLPVEAAAREAEMRGVGRKLVEGRIDGSSPVRRRLAGCQIRTSAHARAGVPPVLA